MTLLETTLHNGIRMPLIGLGLYQVTNEQCEVAVPAALKSGYRLFDSARYYQNEGALQAALEHHLGQFGLERKDVFVETKISAREQGLEDGRAAIADSLKTFNGQIDLMIVHWPGSAKLAPEDPANAVNRRGTWKALEEAYKVGKLRSIGVSNYTEKHLREMLEYAEVMPMVNQVELHPLLHMPTHAKMIEFCREHGIIVQAYSPLARAAPELIENAVLKGIAAKVNKTVAQVALRWSLHHGYAILPKSVKPERIASNYALEDFELSLEDMAAIDGIKETKRTCWDPTTVA